MVSFGKNKDDKAAEKLRYRYEPTSVADKEIADVLLTGQNEPPLVAALVESDADNKGDDVIYELVVEDEKDNGNFANESANEPSEAANLNEQVARLCHEYEVINQQLEKSLVASNDLTRQLEKSKKVVTASYVALGVAGLACLLGVGAIMTGISMQRDVDDLKSSLVTLTNQTTAAKQELTLKNQNLDGQIAQLHGKVDKVFADNNLESVLQVTQELKKQVNALANKNLAIMSSHNHSEKPQLKESKVSLPSLKLDSGAETATDKKQLLEKTAQNAKLPAFDDVEAIPAKQKKYRWHQSLGKKLKRQQKTQKHAEHVEKTAKPPAPPVLPQLE